MTINGGTPRSFMLMGFFTIYKPPFLRSLVPPFRETPISPLIGPGEEDAHAASEESRLAGESQ